MFGICSHYVISSLREKTISTYTFHEMSNIAKRAGQSEKHIERKENTKSQTMQIPACGKLNISRLIKSQVASSKKHDARIAKL